MDHIYIIINEGLVCYEVEKETEKQYRVKNPYRVTGQTGGDGRHYKTVFKSSPMLYTDYNSAVLALMDQQADIVKCLAADLKEAKRDLDKIKEDFKARKGKPE